MKQKNCTQTLTFTNVEVKEVYIYLVGMHFYCKALQLQNV